MQAVVTYSIFPINIIVTAKFYVKFMARTSEARKISFQSRGNFNCEVFLGVENRMNVFIKVTTRGGIYVALQCLNPTIFEP